MAIVEKNIFVNAMPDKIWRLAQDPNHWHTWFDGLRQPKSIQGDGSVGTVVETGMTVANIPIPAKLTVVETVPGARWKGEFAGPLTEGHQLWLYEPAEGGTRLTLHMEANLSGPAKLAEGLVVSSFTQMVDKTLANIKTLAEA